MSIIVYDFLRIVISIKKTRGTKKFTINSIVFFWRPLYACMYSNNNMMIRSIKVESTNEPKMREAKVNRNKLE
jgi:hypothetical protein